MIGRALRPSNLEPGAAVIEIHLEMIGADQSQLGLGLLRGRTRAGRDMELRIVHAPAIILDLALQPAPEAVERQLLDLPPRPEALDHGPASYHERSANVTRTTILTETAAPLTMVGAYFH